MRGEFGSISRKGSDESFGYGMRSRLHRVVQDSSLVVEAFKQSCWANLSPELLRVVLMRIEGSQSTWPPRKNVVACAGVCRSWREIMKEVVKTPEVSTKLTFPISLKQFLLPTRKCRRPTCTDYVISLNGEDLSKGSCTYIGKLRSNYLRTKFTIYDG
ncbi:hypothetical protein LWI29_032252 [Acer saccharum]|uniref:Tubby C-terminal domain-containing protein n=1 Tax=Acer saccharum TaxID=4024 RepID=A0AA39VLI4_ACESA|nr:hypothetical protein LWI29_032252 [Acer saccharum]